MHIADTLRNVEIEVNLLSAQLPITDEKLSHFKTATAEDAELQLVMKAVKLGWPEHVHQVLAEIKKYWTFREELSCPEGLVFKNSRLVVPERLRAEMLQKIHEAHLGIVKCKDRARDVLFWPGMSKQIEDIVMKCSVCNTFKKNNVKEPLLCHDIPDRSWAKLGVDLFHFDQGDFTLCRLLLKVSRNCKTAPDNKQTGNCSSEIHVCKSWNPR